MDDGTTYELLRLADIPQFNNNYAQIFSEYERGRNNGLQIFITLVTKDCSYVYNREVVESESPRHSNLRIKYCPW